MNDLLKRLSPRDRLFLLYGGIIVAAILVYFFAVEPLRNGYRELKEEIPRVAGMKQRYKDVLATASAKEKEKAFLDKEFNRLTGYFFQGETEALATGQLADEVRTSATKVGVTLISSKLEKPEPFNMFQMINLEVTFNASLGQLAEFMKEVQNSAKVVRIRGAKLTVQKDSYPDDTPEVLAVKLLLTGLRFIPE